MTRLVFAVRAHKHTHVIGRPRDGNTWWWWFECECECESVEHAKLTQFSVTANQHQPVRADQEEQLPGLQFEPDPAVRQLDRQVPATAVQGEHHPLRSEAGESVVLILDKEFSTTVLMDYNFIFNNIQLLDNCIPKNPFS